MCYALHKRGLGVDNSIKNCSAKCDFRADHVHTDYDKAMKINKDEENHWHSLQILGMQLEDQTTCDSALNVGAVHTVSQVLDQQFTRPEELEKAEHGVATDEVTFLDTLRRLRSSQKE